MNEILGTFNHALGFYLLINGMLQIVVPDDFDLEYAISHLPNEFGGLRISYVPQGIVPTAEMPASSPTISGSSNSTITILPPGSSQPTSPTQRQHYANTSISSKSNISMGPKTDMTTVKLELGSMVQVKVEKSKASERFQGKIGLMTMSKEEYFLVVSSHVLTQALAAAKCDFFPGPEWHSHVTVISSNGGREIGKSPETFDPHARNFPHGFAHDVSLVDVTCAPTHLVSNIKAPIPTEWLDQEGWSRIKLITQTLFLLDSPSIQSKSIGVLGSQFQMVGQSIFKVHASAEKKTRFKFSFTNKRSNSSSSVTTPETWTALVSRSVLYRVSPDFRSPSAASGTAVCIHVADAEGVEMDGGNEEESGSDSDTIETVKVAGFSSFAQLVSDVQRFDMEGKKVYSRLEEGRVAFYGAMQAPEKLMKEHSIVY